LLSEFLTPTPHELEGRQSRRIAADVAKLLELLQKE
jgi:hypothetical protein